MKLTFKQRKTLVGILLGDGSLSWNRNKTLYRLHVLQSHQHKDYVFHLYEIFKPLVSREPKNYVFTDKRFPGKTYSRWSFNTLSLSCLKFYGKLFYPKGKKVVPKNIKRFLTARAISYWYMDDGAQKWKNKSKADSFCTDSFTICEVKLLIFVLLHFFYLECTIEKKGSGFRIYVKTKSYPVLKGHIYSYLHQSMLYLFPS